MPLPKRGHDDAPASGRPNGSHGRSVARRPFLGACPSANVAGDAMVRPTLLCSALLLTGCADILGIEERVFDDSTPCETTIDCYQQLGGGQFCSTEGRCTTTPPDDDACRMFEPEALERVSDHDFTAQDPIVLGSLYRANQMDEVTRIEAMRLAVREINGRGGLGASRRLVFVGCDYGSDASLLADDIDYLAHGLGSTVISGPIPSFSTQAAIDHIVDQGLSVALVSSTSTSTALIEYPDNGLLWRTSPNDLGQAAVLADIIEQAAVSKLAIVFVNDTYGSALQERVNAEVTGIDTALFSYDDGDTFDGLMANVATYDPDGMLVIALKPENAIAIYEALVAEGLDATVDAHFLADSVKAEAMLDPALSAAVRGELAQALGTAPFHSTEPHYDTFELNLSGAGVDPDSTSFLAQSYDAIYLAGYGLAFAQAAPAPRLGARVAEGFSQLVSGQPTLVGPNNWPAAVAALTDADLDLSDRQIDIDGTGGPLDFDVTTGDAPGNYEIWRIDDTAFTTCAVCLADEPCDLSGC